MRHGPAAICKTVQAASARKPCDSNHRLKLYYGGVWPAEGRQPCRAGLRDSQVTAGRVHQHSHPQDPCRVPSPASLLPKAGGIGRGMLV